jgi:hypothetical protein
MSVSRTAGITLYFSIRYALEVAIVVNEMNCISSEDA